MSRLSTCPLRIFLLVNSVLFAAIAASGCGDNSGVGPTFPVAGKVTIDNAPLTAKSTVVQFKPDNSKGNAGLFEPVGTVDGNGNYTLTTKGKKGAPPGWYKVIVTARGEAPPVHPKTPRQNLPVSQSLLPAKYGLEKTSDLSIEVVENPVPGAYDLKLSK